MAQSFSRIASAEFASCVEIVELMLQDCSWSTAVAVGQANARLRSIVSGVIRYRVRKFVSIFIPDANMPFFFSLLENTDAVIAGSLVRCIMSFDEFPKYMRVHPTQLNIVLPFRPQTYSCEMGTLEYKRWRCLLNMCGFSDEYGSGDGIAPFHLSATSTSWSTMKSAKRPYLRISLLQSKTPSALSPILQSAHTSSFFAMSSGRFYCMYPKLFAAKVSVAMRERTPILKCAFDYFNYGLLSFGSTEDWGVFEDGTCGEACPSAWRRTRGLKGVGIFGWHGFKGIKPLGLPEGAKDPFELRNEMWKIHGKCANPTCPGVLLCTNLFKCIY